MTYVPLLGCEMLCTVRSRPLGAADAVPPTITWPSVSEATWVGAGAGQVSVPATSDASRFMVDCVSTTAREVSRTVGVTGALRLAFCPVPAALTAFNQKQKYSLAGSDVITRLVAVPVTVFVVGEEPEAGAQPLPHAVPLLLATIC